MSKVALSADAIAEHQLLSAIRRWKEKDYISAITLAGAAEEILGKRLRKIGKEASFDNVKAAVLSLAKSLGEDAHKLDSTIADLINQTKNELKHYSGDDELEFDLKEDAIELIDRAIANYTMLTGNALDEMVDFWGDVGRA